MRGFRFLVIAAVFALVAVACSADPFVGKWQLDTKLSRYPHGFCPKQMTIEMTAVGEGIHYHSETEMVNGNRFTADYTAAYDERPVLVTGAKGVLLPVTLKRVKPNVVEATYRSGSEVRATSRRVISHDSNVMIITTSSRDGGGTPVTNVSVYRRTLAVPVRSFSLSQAKTDLLP